MNGSSGVGLLMYVNTLTNNERNLLDMIICCGTIISIIKPAAVTVFMMYRNIFGPIQNQNLVFGILCIGDWSNIAYCLFFFEGIFIWYITAKDFNIQVKMDEIGMAQCLLFFNSLWAFGLTFLISYVGTTFHQNLIRYSGFPLDSEKTYLVNTRYIYHITIRHNYRNLSYFRWFVTFCISTCLLVLMMVIHKAVICCFKQFKHDQDNGEDIGAKFLLCCLDSELIWLDKKHNSLSVKYIATPNCVEEGTSREIL